MKKTVIFASALFLLPFIASAQALAPLVNIIQAAGYIVNLLIPIVIAIALLVFFWGLVKYIRSSGKGHAEGQKIMVAGLVSLFIMVSVWGIIVLAQGALGVNGNIKTQSAPSVQSSAGAGGTAPTYSI
jgi:multisubunit Na+/H+ antiporter MnhB subunit